MILPGNRLEPVTKDPWAADFDSVAQAFPDAAAPVAVDRSMGGMFMTEQIAGLV